MAISSHLALEEVHSSRSGSAAQFLAEPFRHLAIRSLSTVSCRRGIWSKAFASGLMNVLNWWQGTQQFQAMWCSRNLKDWFQNSLPMVWVCKSLHLASIYCSDFFPKEVDCNFKLTMQFHIDYKGVAWINRLWFATIFYWIHTCWLPPCPVIIHIPSYPLPLACFSWNQRTEEKKGKSLCHETKMDPGMHPKQLGQQVKGSDCPPLFHSHETSHGVQHAALEPPA